MFGARGKRTNEKTCNPSIKRLHPSTRLDIFIFYDTHPITFSVFFFSFRHTNDSVLVVIRLGMASDLNQDVI